MELQEILDNRAVISAKVIEDTRETAMSWGFDVHRFEISELGARDQRVQRALKNQIQAEQESKEKFIQADS